MLVNIDSYANIIEVDSPKWERKSPLDWSCSQVLVSQTQEKGVWTEFSPRYYFPWLKGKSIRMCSTKEGLCSSGI
jgi:hypothetical protein